MYVGVEMVFEIWNEIGNLIDDQKNLINSLNDISIKGNVGISYVLEWFIKWRIENRLGMNGNYDRYTVLNWMKSGIESLYIIILTQFIPLFSLFFSYFSILFFFFQTQWADQFHISAPTLGYFALRKEIIEIDLLVFRTIRRVWLV